MQIADTIKIHHATRAKAEKLAAMLAAEYPVLSLDYDTNEDESQIRQWLVVHGDDVISETPKVPELAAILAICEDQGIDPEEGFEDEPESSGSVVPESYRARYKESSTNGQTCGDWLAEFLTSECHSPDGFVVDEFAQILVTNEVDQSGAWARLPESGQKGWIGRWRMNGRQILEKQVALVGFVRDGRGNRHDLPETELAFLQAKHAKWLDKQAKLAEAHGKETA